MNGFEIILEDMSLEGIGELEITWDFDEDEYQEFLNDGLYHNTYAILMEYIKDNVTFSVETFDNDTFHHVGYEYVDYDDLEDVIGEVKLKEVIKELINSGSSRFETLELYNQESYDINNQDQLNNIAMKILNHGEYYKDCRGFILTNGVVVYTPAEHNMVSQINGINGTFDFIRLGNIRVLSQSIDLSKQPTPEQKDVLRKVISSYSDDVLYLDIYCDGGGVKSCVYNHPDYRYVLGEIDRYFSEGIAPSGKDYYESKKKTGITITESQYKRLFEQFGDGGYMKIIGTPDYFEIRLDDETIQYNFHDYIAYPFLIYENRVYIGGSGDTHRYLLSKCDIDSTKDYVSGRIWTSGKSEKFNHPIVTFWGSKSDNVKGYVRDISNKLNVNPEDIMVIVGFFNKDPKNVPFSEWDGYLKPMSDEEKQAKNLHLMNSKDKLQKTSEFRNARDKKMGKKLTKANGEEMPLAKYHSLIYQESENI